MKKIVGATLSRFHDSEDQFEFLIAYADGKEIGHEISRTAAQAIQRELNKNLDLSSPPPSPHVAPDEDAVETVARRIYEDEHKGMSNIWSWNDRGLDDEHPGTRERYLGYARSAIAATPPPVQHVTPKYEQQEAICTDAAMSQWERSLKRPDMQEKDRVRGAVEAYKRQALAFRMLPPAPQSHLRGAPELYAARICKGIPADCCDYGIIALAEGVEVCRVWTEENARKIARLLNRDSHARQSNMDGNRPLPYDRETLGRFVREAWVRWAETQPNPKPSWLVPYDELSEPDKEADRQIGEALARWTLIGDAARASLSPSPLQREVVR